MLGFVDSVDLDNKKQAGEPEKATWLSSSELMYRRFLIYEMFFAAERPVIICEGETDNVYLLHAMRKMRVEFPELAVTTADGKISLKVRFYKYHRSTARITTRDRGVGALREHLHFNL